MLLELGSGERPYRDGRFWVHSDVRLLDDIDLVIEADNVLESIDPETVEELRAAHLLEHFSYQSTIRILRDWFAVLKPGGKLHVEVPNFSWQARAAVDAIDDGLARGPSGEPFSLKDIINQIFGEQDYEGNYHKAAFTRDILAFSLSEAGFDPFGIHDIGQVLVAEAWRPE